MKNLDRIRGALCYIDAHLDQPVGFEEVAAAFHLSPYYFHRMFSVIVGKPVSGYIRERRLDRACRLLHDTSGTILSVCMECGFDSQQSFSRAFRRRYGIPPGEYRRRGLLPESDSVDELIRRFTNRTKGGILVCPTLIKRPALRVAGLTGDGSRTAQLWQDFLALSGAITEKLPGGSYEVRLYNGREGRCHVGVAVTADPPPSCTVLELPASEYAAFDVYVSEGYESENSAIAEWLAANAGVYRQRKLSGNDYIVEFYDERFNGEEEGSIVEIWVPVERV